MRLRPRLPAIDADMISEPVRGREDLAWQDRDTLRERRLVELERVGPRRHLDPKKKTARWPAYARSFGEIARDRLANRVDATR